MRRLLCAALPTLAALLLGGCPAGDVTLVVNLRTDLVPLIEMREARVFVDGEPVATHAIDPQTDYARGAHLVELRELTPSSSRRVRVEVRGVDGEVIAERSLITENVRPTTVTLVIARSCLGVRCEPSGATPTECVGGVCAPAACATGAEPECPPAQCARDLDCPPMHPCSAPQCVDALCVSASRDECAEGWLCHPVEGCLPLPDVDAGPVDAGLSDAGAGDAGLALPPPEAYAYYFTLRRGSIELLGSAPNTRVVVHRLSDGELLGGASLDRGSLVRLDVEREVPLRLSATAPVGVHTGSAISGRELNLVHPMADDPRRFVGQLSHHGRVGAAAQTAMIGVTAGDYTITSLGEAPRMGSLAADEVVTPTLTVGGDYVFETTGTMALISHHDEAFAGACVVPPRNTPAVGWHSDVGTEFLVPPTTLILFNYSGATPMVTLESLDGTGMSPPTAVSGGMTTIQNNMRFRVLRSTEPIAVWAGVVASDDFHIQSAGDGGLRHIVFGRAGGSLTVYSAYEGTSVTIDDAVPVVLGAHQAHTVATTTGAHFVTANHPVAVEVEVPTHDDSGVVPRAFFFEDDDYDGRPTSAEDENGNGDLYDDDADGDGLPDFLDADT